MHTWLRNGRCSARTIELEEERLSIVKKHFGDVPLSAMTAATIADFQRARHDGGKANRTINMDVGVLSRVLKFCGRWRALADHVHNLADACGGSWRFFRRRAALPISTWRGSETG
jgi:hypothetical protein